MSKRLPNPTNLVIAQPAEYFHGVLLGALRSQKVQATEHAQFYLVNLLSKLTQLESLYPVDQEGKREETLALQLAAALEENNHEQRVSRLRNLGDTSLYDLAEKIVSLLRSLTLAQ